MSTLQLTNDQQRAYDDIVAFLLDPVQPVHVLAGYSGTGKTTLVTEIIKEFSNLIKMGTLLNPALQDLKLYFTATTNKAAENLSFITGRETSTIQSLLGLRVHRDFQTRQTSLAVQKGKDIITDALIVIDEFSYVDPALLGFISSRTKDCKILFIGDPAQLTPIKSTGCCVTASGFPTSTLKEVVRQKHGNPIQDMSTGLRNTVNTGEFFSFSPDGVHIQRQSRSDFESMIASEFTNPDWFDRKSKVLAWTNKTVIAYNKGINNLVKGKPSFSVGDYAVCNRYISNPVCRIKTDELVRIIKMEADESFGLAGNMYWMDGGNKAFMPDSLEEKRELMKRLTKEGELKALSQVEDNWIDLRAAYSCTVNKAQGSTYEKVFIDLDDVGKCRNTNQLARMLYVAVSRAKEQVIFTGDIA